MHTVTIPLVGSMTARNQANAFTKDQFFRGCYFKMVDNTVTGKKTAFVKKRPTVIQGGPQMGSAPFTAIFQSSSTLSTVFASGTTTSTVYCDGASMGSAITNFVIHHISETIISGVTFYLFTARSTANLALGDCYFLAEDAYAVTAYTCDTNGTATISDIKISGVNSVAGLYVGQLVTGTDFAAGTRIASINAGAFTATVTINATGTTNDMAMTKTPLARIRDADFPTNVIGEMIELSGFVFVATMDGKIYQSDINSITSWTATAFISMNLYTDDGIGLAKDGDKIIGFGASSAEWFYNAGNPTGSVLSKTGRSMPVGAKANFAFPRLSCISSQGQVICWAAQNGATQQVWMLSGGNQQKISSPFLETMINNVDLYCIRSFSMDGERFVFVSWTASSVDYNFVYNLESGLWTDLALHDVMIIAQVSGIGPSISNASGAVILAEAVDTTGIASSFNIEETAQDSVGTRTMTLQLSPINHGTDKRKFITSLRLIGADTQSSGTLTVSFSDNDYTSFTTWGTLDMTIADKRLTRGGSYKGGRAYKFVHTASTPFRAQAIEIEYEVGSA